MSDPHVTNAVNPAAVVPETGNGAPPPPKAGVPILIVDLGEKKRKQIKQLHQGRGKLFDEVTELLKELRGSATIPADAQPVVLVVKERNDNKSLLSWLD